MRWKGSLQRLRSALQLRCGLEPKAVLALAVLALVAVAFAGQRYWSGRPERVEVPRAVQPVTPPGEPRGHLPVPGTPTRSSAPAVVVDIAGKVRHPGVRRLPAGSRVSDALRAAGGAVPGTDTSTLNLARVLADGEQVLVGAPAGGPGPAAGGTGGIGGAATPGTTPVSLNSATAEQLDTLPGVGPVLAQHIIDYRMQNGGFSSIDQLRDVNGIGQRRFSDLRPLVRL